MTEPLPRKERGIKKVASWLVALLYERVEVHRSDGGPTPGAELGVANHFGGFADPLLLLHAMDRVPRYIASDVIWKYPIVGRVLDWVGAIPVHKREESGSGDNRAMFRSTYEALGDGDLVVIFPEGITVDDPAIAKVKTGAARIALGARSSGVTGLQIVPAGIYYEDKASLRSKVFINLGRATDLDGWLAETGLDGSEESRETVTELTDLIETKLRRTAPNFVDWRQAKALAFAAEVAIRNTGDDDRAVGHGERERIASTLSRSSEDSTAAVIEAAGRYQRDLDALGLSDRAFYGYRGRPGRVLRYLVVTLLVGLVLLPFALAGLAVNIVPILLLWLVGRLKLAPAMFATVKPLAAVLFFGVAWTIELWSALRIGGPAWAVLNLLLLPFYLFALIAVAERGVRLWRALRQLGSYRKWRSVGDEILGHRLAVVRTVAEAL